MGGIVASERDRAGGRNHRNGPDKPKELAGGHRAPEPPRALLLLAPVEAVGEGDQVLALLGRQHVGQVGEARDGQLRGAVGELQLLLAQPLRSPRGRSAASRTPSRSPRGSRGASRAIGPSSSTSLSVMRRACCFCSSVAFTPRSAHSTAIAACSLAAGRVLQDLRAEPVAAVARTSRAGPRKAIARGAITPSAASPARAPPPSQNVRRRQSGVPTRLRSLVRVDHDFFSLSPGASSPLTTKDGTAAFRPVCGRDEEV